MRKFDLFKRKQNEQDRFLGKVSLYILVVFALLILFEKVIGHLPVIGNSITTFFHYLSGLISPFIMGFAIAYVMNPFMMFFEKKFLKWFGFCRNHKKLTRTFCILLMYTLVIGGTVWIVIYLLPEIRNSIIAFATNISEYSEAMSERIRYIFDQIPYIDSAEVNKVIDRFMEPIKHMSQNAPEILETIAANVYSFGRITLNFIMAIFIAFYMLYDKERFARKTRKAVYAFSTDEKGTRFLQNANRVHHIFNDFIVGKALDSLIIGILAFSIGSAGGVLLAKFMNLFTKNKINPLIGSAGVSAVPMAARVSQNVGQEANPGNFLLMHAMGPNVAGVIGSAVAAGILLSFLG